MYVPWAEELGQQRSVTTFAGDGNGTSAAAPAAPGSSNMTLVGNADKDGTVNSDLAFWGQLAYAGNYDGFRVLDVKGQQPRTVVDFKCRGPQNDVSVYEMGGKRFLFQSIDSGQTSEDCSSVDAPIVGGMRTGYEGIRVFDVTNPAQPKFLDMIQTACGSHTHTLVPDGKRAYIYISSYPLGSGVTLPEGPGDFRPCSPPHKKISIIEASAPKGEFSFELKEKELSDDTAFNRGFQACHDIQVFEPKDLAVGSCAGDGQLWDVSNPANPTAGNGEPHTHIYSPSPTDQFEFIHSGIVSWDGKTFAIMDETGGGGAAECDGAASDDGFYYFYDVVKPGAAAPPLESRYTIPRPQSPEICVSHNANVIPVRKRNLMVAAYYQGGNTVVDFTDPSKPREIGYSDLEDPTGLADSWSTYWYNGRVYTNGGLNRRGASGNRGLDVFELTGDAGRASKGAKHWRYSNPQTQEEFQSPGR
ncbi:MAG: LVIVD repeat-containing protein [Solirubrobacteraceae bacterium]